MVLNDVDLSGRINGLDLFSGIGGISLALREWVRPIAYCEIDSYCQGVLLSRMDANDLCVAPLWDDVSTLEGEQFRGLVDIIYGGFPCQGVSCAGLGKGLADERSGLFFEMLRLCREIKPRFIFLENVSAITCRGGLEVVRSVASLGYDCRWCTISAASVGAPHKRDRWFLLAHSNSARLEKRIERESNKFPSIERDSWWSVEPDVGRVAHGIPLELDLLIFICEKMDEQRCEKEYNQEEISEIDLFNREVLRTMWKHREIATSSPELYIRRLQDLLPGMPQNRAFERELLGKRIEKRSELYNLWQKFYSSTEQAEQALWQSKLLENLWEIKCKEKMGKEFRVHRIKSLGNSVVPQQTKEAFKILMGIK